MDVLLLDTLGSNDPAKLLAISTEFHRDQPGGRSQSFFSDRTIYDATAVIQTSETGAEDGFLGHVAIAPGGGLGFNPEVVLSGTVDGTGLRNFFAAEIGPGNSGATIWQDMFAGDDYIRDNSSGHDLYGYGGDDVLVNGPHQARLDGGDGDDILFTAPGFYSTVGGAGADTFVVTDFRGSGLAGFASDFEHGIDRIALDAHLVPGLGPKISTDSFHFGRGAKDAEDRLIVNYIDRYHYAYVYYDPDGTGPLQKQLIGTMASAIRPGRLDFEVVDAQALLPDVFSQSGRPDSLADLRSAEHAMFAGHDLTGIHSPSLVHLV